MKTYFFNILLHIKTKLKIILVNITLIKFILTFFSIILTALIKYYIFEIFSKDNLCLVNDITLILLSLILNIRLID